MRFGRDHLKHVAQAKPGDRAFASGESLALFGRAARELASVKENADEETGQDELNGGGESAAPMPAPEPVAWEELAAARPREAEEVLEVRTGSCKCAGDSGIKWSARSCQEQDAGDARADLEAPVGDVLVRDPIAGHM
jgi:hypothetical protein